eukprot:CAMPEP_0201710248 /NCGR_PEP_ID=MMETSP0578-20130828/58528_1 /ASSEMBLY_ACC=CAM_ASM_000663 /TAXON_ID=267565 /ORGANISM="Skeletonema grethea, Strain CCMP 1804" /LENGTH=386 /DNA_ID=CAMNT_0048199273 /DNA_START=126 /DNA_END=1283 /DNA_ORIENTATION=+
MSARGDDNFVRYIYRGEEGEVIPDGATHIAVREDVTNIRSRAFFEHRNIIEVIFHEGVEKIEHRAFEGCQRLRQVIMPGVKVVEQIAFFGCLALTDVECGKLEIIENLAFCFCASLKASTVIFHEGVEKIEEEAFFRCTSLRRGIMPGVKIAENGAFCGCEALTDVEWGKLEIIGRNAFCFCPSLRSINLPSVEIVKGWAFSSCYGLTDATFCSKLERFDDCAFCVCESLERLTIPLKDGLITRDTIFIRCENLNCLTDVECGKLEIIENLAFCFCASLKSINLKSARIVEGSAFSNCFDLTEATFSSKLERFDDFAFCVCDSLERLTIPLKDGLITRDTIFIRCENLNCVDLVEGELHETIASLQLEEWRNDMNEEIDSINQTLP